MYLIYDSLNKLPISIFFEIVETENVKLLSRDNWLISTRIGRLISSIFKLKQSDKSLILLWNKLYDEFNEKHGNKDKRTFKIHVKIESLIAKYKAVKISADVLKTKKDKALIDNLKKDGYKLNENTFNSDLLRIEREAEALVLRAEVMREKLPKTEYKKEVSIYDTISSYSAILGFDIDFEKVSVSKFFSLQKQVKQKIKMLENG